MENYPVIKDNIKINNLLDLIKIHFYIKMIEKGVDKISEKKKLSNRELLIICELYNYGGLLVKDDLKKFTNICVEKELSENSIQSIRNVLGKARALGIVKRPKANKWVVANDYLPHLDDKKLIFKYTIHNLDV